MPKINTNARPDRKVTDFFLKRPKTGPRPGQPIFDISSSSETQSIISISPDDTPASLDPQLLHPSRVHDNVRTSPRLHKASSAHATVHVPSHSTATVASFRPASSGPSDMISNNDLITSKPSSKRPTLSVPKKGKKRKHSPISLITSDSSDDPVYPSIYALVKRSEKVESKFNCVTARSDLSYPSTVAPLTPRQNILDPSKSPRKLDTAQVIIASSIKACPSPPPPKNTTPQTPKHHMPSPPKRARHTSTSRPETSPFSAPDFDADDESEPHATSSPGRSNKGIPKHTPVGKNAEEVVSGENLVADVDTDAVPPHSGCDDHEVLPSSQKNEVELHMDTDGDSMDVDTRDFATIPTPNTVSPTKARTDSIIARIKAKAEAEAEAEAELQTQDERRRSSLGLLGGEVSDLSSLPSSTDEDESELDLKLSSFGRGNATKSSGTYVSSALGHPRSVTPPEAGTRRSTRNVALSAPNYATKLDLFRIDSPFVSGLDGKDKVDAKAKGKAKVSACPLDMLLRDHQREDARKARVETKRKINSSEILGSEATSDRSSSVLQTPRSGRHASQAENNKGGESDASSENALMSAKAQAQLLGKESAQAVKRILDGDRKRKVVEETKEITAVTFWREGTGLVENVLPQLVTDQSNPFLVVLGDMLNSNNYVVASSLIDSGALTTVPLSTQLHEWLFSTAMSTVNESISNSAYRVLLVLHRESYSTDIVARAQLSQRMILTPLFKHGVNTKIVQLLKIGEETGSVFGSSQEMKVERACRFVIMLEALGRSQNIALEAIPTVISVLLLLSLEPATNSSLCQDALSAIEAILSSSIMTRAIELDVCRFVLHVVKGLGLPPVCQTRLLRLLQGCSSSSGRVRRWVAWAMLGGDLQSTHGCGDVPPIDLIVNMFSTDSPGDIKLIVTPDTDYVLLSAIVDILSVAMSDVDAYVRSTGGPASTNTICEALERLNGKIVDTRAAHMDRTQAKGAIDRLHKRLVYQRHAVKEMLQTKTGKLDQFFLPKRKA